MALTVSYVPYLLDSDDESHDSRVRYVLFSGWLCVIVWIDYVVSRSNVEAVLSFHRNLEKLF